MSSAARWTSAILAPLIALFASAGWYLARTLLVAYRMDAGAPMEEMGAIRTTQSLVAMIGLVVAGVLAIVTGASVPLILGAGVLSAGLFALAVLPVEAAPLAYGVAAFGFWMILPAIYGALARALDGELESLRNAAFLVVLVAFSVGGFASPLLGETLRAVGGFTPVFLTAGALAGFALVLAVIFGVVVLMTREKEPAKKKVAPVRWSRVGVVAVLVVVCVVPWALGTSHWFLLAPELGARLSSTEMNMLEALSPGAVIAVALLAALAFVVLHALRVKVPALLVAGIGLVVLGVAAASSAALIDPEVSFVTLGAVLVIGGLGEALFAPLLLSRMTADLPLRLETGVAAAWMFGGRVIMMLTAMVAEEPSGQRALLWVGALASLVVGVALAAASLPLRRVFAIEPARAAPALPTARASS